MQQHEIFNKILTHVDPISKRCLMKYVASLVRFDESKGLAIFAVKTAWLKLVVSWEPYLQEALKIIYDKEFVIFMYPTKGNK